MASDAYLSEPWRRVWKYCRPTNGVGEAEAERFYREFLEGADGEDCDDDFTYGEVFRGTHQGGAAATATALPGPRTAGYQAAKNRMDKRNRRAATRILSYIVENETLKDALRKHPNNGEKMYGQHVVINKRSSSA